MKRATAIAAVWTAALLVTGCTAVGTDAAEHGGTKVGISQPPSGKDGASPSVHQSGCEIVEEAGREANQALLADFAELDVARDDVVARLPRRASSYASRIADLDLPPAARSASRDVQEALDRLATEVSAATEEPPFDTARIQAVVSDAQQALSESMEAFSQPG